MTITPDASVAVVCAAWHGDPDRHELLRGHQACLAGQTVPVTPVYVLDAGDRPPPWLQGRVVVAAAPLTIYEAWSLAVQHCDADLVMNLNLDDRLVADGVEQLVAGLGDGMLVGGDWRVAYDVASTRSTHLRRSQRASQVPFSPAWPPRHGSVTRLGSGTGQRGTLGPATLWRRSLHDALPYPHRFGDGSPIRSVGDLAWWQAVAAAHPGGLRRAPVVVGDYLSRPAQQAEFRHGGEEALLAAHGVARDAFAPDAVAVVEQWHELPTPAAVTRPVAAVDLADLADRASGPTLSSMLVADGADDARFALDAVRAAAVALDDEVVVLAHRPGRPAAGELPSSLVDVARAGGAVVLVGPDDDADPAVVDAVTTGRAQVVVRRDVLAELDLGCLPAGSRWTTAAVVVGLLTRVPVTVTRVARPGGAQPAPTTSDRLDRFAAMEVGALLVRLAAAAPLLAQDGIARGVADAVERTLAAPGPPVPTHAVRRPRLVCSINSGRAGSRYLAALLGSAERTWAEHEAVPMMAGPALRHAMEHGDPPAAHTAEKVRAIEQRLRHLPPGWTYAETNHMFVKTFGDAVATHWGDALAVVHLRRDPLQVLRSFLDLGWFGDREHSWPDWMHRVPSAMSVIRPTTPWEHMDQVDRTIAYLLDVEARGAALRARHPDVRVHEAWLDDLQSAEAAEVLLTTLGLRPGPTTATVVGRRVNRRDALKATRDGRSDAELAAQVDAFCADNDVALPAAFATRLAARAVAVGA